MTRPDGRISGTSLRPLSCQLHSLSRADGSAHWTSGSTSILAAVYGPVPPKISSRERLDLGFVVVAFQHGNHRSKTQRSNFSIEGPEVERLLTDTFTACIDLKQYPRLVIEIVLQVVQWDGSVLASALNAGVLALMDAGVHMKFCPIGTCCLIEKGDEPVNILLDPNGEEEESDDADSKGTLIFVATDSVDGAMITCTTLGSNPWDLSSLTACVEAARMASKAIVIFMRMAMEQSHKIKI